MNIAFYIPSLSGGGAERNTVLISNQLIKFGHSVTIILDRYEGPNIDILDDSINIKVLAGKNSHITSIFGLLRYLKSKNFDYVFCRIGMCPFKCFLVSFFNSTKYIASFHNPYEKNKPIGGRLSYIFSKFIVKRSFNSFAVSEDIIKELETTFKVQPSSVKKIFNPVDFKYIKRTQELNNESYSALPKNYLISAGRLTSQKRFDILIDAFDIVKNSYDGDLIIMGDGELREPLINKIEQLGLENRIHLIGYKNNPFFYYKHADAFVLSSEYEGFGNVILEALSLGTKVISTNCPGGPKEILDHGRFGWLCEVNDKKSLAVTILDALRENHKSKEDILDYLSEFSVSYIARKYLDLMQ